MTDRCTKLARDLHLALMAMAREGTISKVTVEFSRDPGPALAEALLPFIASRPSESSASVGGEAFAANIDTGERRAVGYAAHEIGTMVAKRDAEFEDALKDLSIPPDASSLDELDRSIFGALTDCPSMSLDKQANFVARALWPSLRTQAPAREGETMVVPLDAGPNFSDSTLPLDVIHAGAEAIDRANDDMANYVSGETTDWDSGMMAVAVYRAMTAALSRQHQEGEGRE